MIKCSLYDLKSGHIVVLATEKPLCRRTLFKTLIGKVLSLLLFATFQRFTFLFVNPKNLCIWNFITKLMSDTKEVLIIVIRFSYYYTFFRFNVSLSNCSIGDSCVIHNGVCIGQDGKAQFISLLVCLFLFRCLLVF